MIEGLRISGVEVIECHEKLWGGINDRVNIVSGGWKTPHFWLRVLKTYIKLIIQYNKIKDYDIMVVGYPGHFDVYIARILTWIKRKPLVWDILMSLYLITAERNLIDKSPFIIKTIRKLEETACKLPNLLILESVQYGKWFSLNYSVPMNKFCFIPLGALESKRTSDEKSVNKKDIFTVLYYGSFIPNHGVSIMLESAAKLKNYNDIHFEFVGEGPEKLEIQERAKELQNVTFHGFLSNEKLNEIISNSDLCLGVFGNTSQSMMTIQNKINECLSMSKPIITGYSQLIDETFIHKKHLYICKRNAVDLADAILELKKDSILREFIAKNGNLYFHEKFRTEVIGNIFLDCLNQLRIK